MSASSKRPFAGLQKINFNGVRFRLIDAKDQTVGRLSAQITKILQGKDKPTFNNNEDNGDVCIVINAAHINFTGSKWDDKQYRWHTGYPGGQRSISARKLWEKDPTEIIRKAVNGMLPKNRLREDRMRKLRVFPLEQHAFEAFPLERWEMPPRQLRNRKLDWQLPEGFSPMNEAAYQRRLRASKLRPADGQPPVEFEDLLAPEERKLLEDMRRRSL